MSKSLKNLEELKMKKMLLKQELHFREAELKKMNRYFAENKFKIIWNEISPFSSPNNDFNLLGDIVLPGLLGALGITQVSSNSTLLEIVQTVLDKIKESRFGKIFSKKQKSENEEISISEESNV